MTANRYAKTTSVPVARTKAELEELLLAHGASRTAVMTETGRAVIAFEMADRRIVFRLPLPDANGREFTHYVDGRSRSEKPRTHDAARAAWEQECRQKWRALLLAVKAKLVSVQEGVETFEQAFLAHILMPDGLTVADHTVPRIEQAYTSGTSVPLLTFGGDK